MFLSALSNLAECSRYVCSMYKETCAILTEFLWNSNWICDFLQPDIKAIKKRMEDLITRDYLERDKENANMFRYLA